MYPQQPSPTTATVVQPQSQTQTPAQEKSPVSVSAPATTATTQNSNNPNLNHNISMGEYQRRQQQLSQIHAFLQEKGVLKMAPGVRKQYFQRHPELVQLTKAFFEKIGLSGKSFFDLQRYFQEVGLNFMATANPEAPVMQPQVYTFHYSLSQVQKNSFVERGFLIVNDVVGKEFRDDALRVVNRSLGRGVDHSNVAEHNQSSWCPELAPSPAVLNLLYRTPALAVALSLIGPIVNVTYGIIALRHPGFGCLSPFDEKGKGYSAELLADHFIPHPNWTNWEIEGLTNISESQNIRNHTCTMTVFLSSIPNPLSGNLTLYPGSHRVLQSTIRTLGGPDHAKNLKHYRNQINLGEPEQLSVRAGDIVLHHYLTASCDSPNLSPDIRYAVTFHLYHAGHVPNVFRPESLEDIWLEYDGLRELIYANNLVLLSQTRPCVQCRTSINIDSRFCCYCGHPQQQPANAKSE